MRHLIFDNFVLKCVSAFPQTLGCVWIYSSVLRERSESSKKSVKLLMSRILVTFGNRSFGLLKLPLQYVFRFLVIDRLSHVPKKIGKGRTIQLRGWRGCRGRRRRRRRGRRWRRWSTARRLRCSEDGEGV